MAISMTDNNSLLSRRWRRLGYENKNFVICFAFHLACTIFAGMKTILLTILAILSTSVAWSQSDDVTTNTVEAYAILSPDGHTLTFTYDDEREEKNSNTYSLCNWETCPEWKNDKANITTVVFMPSFSEARPTSTRSWFEGMTQLNSIEGMENLNTSEVNDMSYMFYNCQSLTGLDLSTFDTHNSTQMNNMFQYCLSLESINLSHFDTSNNNSFFRMFQGCTRLNDLDISSFTININADSRYMLHNCTKLESLTIPYSMEEASITACTGVGTQETPCKLVVPQDFNLGIDITENCFRWKSGFFRLPVTDTEIIVEPVSMLPGATAYLTVCLNNDTTKTFNGYQMDIHLPEGFSIVKNNNQYSIQASERYSNQDMALTATEKDDNNYRIICFSLSNATITGTEGPLFTIEIHSDSLVEEGIHTGSITDMTFSTVQGVSILPEKSDFTITIIDDFAIGDVNHDREVDVNDVMLVVNHILGYPNPVFFMENADTDDNDQIDISDVMAIVGIILNGI